MKRNIKKVVILFVFIIFIAGNFTNAIIADEENDITSEDSEIYSTTVSFEIAPPENEEIFETYSRLPSNTYGIESVIPPDDRVRITDTTSFPWRTICKLYIFHPDPDFPYCAIGTAFMVDEFHVLTAGHCVYLHEEDGWPYDSWAYAIRVIPGMNNGNEPFGYAWATFLRSYTGWTSSHSSNHDWGLITLNSSFDSNGWMGRQTASSSNAIYTGILNTAGYPGDLDNGLNMYFDSDVGSYATEYRHYYYMDTCGGQSGSPVWIYDGTNRYVLSIHTLGGYSINSGTRLNQDKFDQLNDWLEEDSPSNPLIGYSPTYYDFGDMYEDQTDLTTFQIWNSGTGTLTYTLSESCSWCSVSPTGGSSTGEHNTITVNVDTTGLSVGSHSYDITIDSNEGSGTFSVSVNVVLSPNEPPIANFTYYPQNPTDLQNVTFTDNSTDLDGLIVSWFWNFNDGATSTEQHPTHQYADNGTYTVTLNVTDDDGDMDSKEKTITVIGEVISWSVQLNFSEDGGNYDYVVFGEASDANDGPPVDDYDAMKPPPPPPPYFQAWFDDNLPMPYNALWEDFRQYPDTEKTWDLSVQWMSDSSTPTNINISWDINEFANCEYNNITLMRYDPFDEEWDFAADMLVANNYVYMPRWFNEQWLMDHFQINATGEPWNNPPNTPSNPNPNNDATGVDINADLSWTGGDPDPGDTVTYDVYFGTTSPPSQVAWGQTATTYEPGTLSFGTTYYWQIVAEDSYGATTSAPIWSFTTEDHGPGPQPPPLYVYIDDGYNESTPGWGVDHFDKIQDGINAVAENGTIYVYSGTYYENVVIHKSINLIGEDRNNTVIDGMGIPDENAVTITVDWVNISGFTITRGTYWYHAGVFLENVGNCSIYDNTILDNFDGIRIVSSSFIIITNNTFRSNSGYAGVLLYDNSNNITVTDNVFFDRGLAVGRTVKDNTIGNNTINNKPLIYLENYYNQIIDGGAGQVVAILCDNITMTNLNISNAGLAIELSGCNNCNIVDSNFSNNLVGVTLFESCDNHINNITVFNNTIGFWIASSSDNNTIFQTMIIGNEDAGLGLDEYCCNNTISENMIKDNIGYGINIDTYSCYNNIYNNYFNNTNNAWDDGNNQWNITKTSGTNIIGGYWLGGNYWDDYDGTDVDGDDLGDTPYNLSGGDNKDNHPLCYHVNQPPVVGDIPDQTIIEGEIFATIPLDDYVEDLEDPDENITWSYSGDTDLTVDITDCVATISTPDEDWFGSETITFTATDTGGLLDSDNAAFTVSAVNDAPVVGDIPDQTILEGESFAVINLDDYVDDPDNDDDEMTWVASGNVELSVVIVDRVATVTPPSSEWNGSETITFTAEDTSGLTGLDNATFTVQLVDVNVDNVVDDDTGGDTGGGGGNEDPVANASASETFGFVGTPVTFDGSLSTDDGTITNYTWDFDDGTTGYGETTTHVYTEPGTYTVTLTVTDNESATDDDIIQVIISQPNLPPTNLTVDGLTIGNKNIEYNYSATATDPDTPYTIQYTFNWSDGTNDTTSSFLPSNTTFNTSHNWTAAGRYVAKVTAKDELNATDSAELIVLIDAKYVSDLGYLIDNNGNGTYDAFYSNETGNKTTTEDDSENGTYLINSDGVEGWDYIYDPVTDTLTECEGEEEAVPPEEDNLVWYMLALGVIISIIVLLAIFHVTKKK